MEIGNLILLIFARYKDSYPGVFNFEEAVEMVSPILKIDLKEQTWSCETGELYPIGRGREVKFSPELPIGIYDRTNTEHLSQMIKDADRAYHYPGRW